MSSPATDKHDRLGFRVERLREVIPQINDRSLIELVATFERSHGFDPAGRYGGAHPESETINELAAHYLGRGPDEALTDEPKIALLACGCGELGCWPLLARAHVDGDFLVWDQFEQPHRSGRGLGSRKVEIWDYSDFGPFVFSLIQFRTAIRDLHRALVANRSSE